MTAFVTQPNLGADFDQGTQVAGKLNIVAATTGIYGKMKFGLPAELAAAAAGVVADASQVQRRGHTAISDAAYAILTLDAFVGMKTLTAARIWTLPPAASYPPGATLFTADETGLASSSLPITVQAASVSTTANGATSASASVVVASPTNITSGQVVTGPGVTNPTTVLSVSGTTVNLSQNATIANGGSLTFSDVVITGGLIGGLPITAVNMMGPGQKLAWHSNGSNGWTYS